MTPVIIDAEFIVCRETTTNYQDLPLQAVLIHAFKVCREVSKKCNLYRAIKMTVDMLQVEL